MPFVERLSATSSMSGREFKAHRKFAFQILGFGVSFSLNFPVCSAHARNRQASVFIFQPFLEACFQGSRNIFFSSSTHTTPGYFWLLIIPSSHGRIRNLSTGISEIQCNTLAADGNVAVKTSVGLVLQTTAGCSSAIRLRLDFDLSRTSQSYTSCAGISNNETVSQSHAYVLLSIFTCNFA